MNDFFTVLSAAVNDFILYGYDDEQRLKQWLAKLRFSAQKSLISDHKMEQEINRALTKAFDRLVIRGGLVNKEVSKFTVDKLKPKLRAELQRRIFASSNLIKENREEAINSTLRRFQGWATSIPEGGSKAVDKVAEKTKIKKDLAAIRFKQNRVIIDQTHKLIGAINEVVATDAGALGLIWHSKWRQAGYDFREDHKERDELIYLLRDTWATKAGLLKPINGYYDQITAVGEEVFCFPGDSKVPFAEGVTKAFRYWYTGVMVEIFTESGKSLRGTPNHPILTDKGWIALGALKNGDNVMEISVELLNAFKENQNHNETTIAEIFSSLNENGVVESLNLRATDFHGDGTNGNVDVVFSDRELTFGMKSSGIESLNQIDFTKSNVSASTIGALNECVEALSLSEQSLVGGGNSTLSLFSSQLRHAEDASGACISNSDSAGNQNFSDISSGYSKLLRQGENTFSTQIFASKIINIEINDFSGHVYNLQTKNEWFVTSTIITHNCGCHAQYIYNLRRFPPEFLTEKGKIHLQSKLPANGVN